jgi:hypothetical protein
MFYGLSLPAFLGIIAFVIVCGAIGIVILSLKFNYEKEQRMAAAKGKSEAQKPKT